VTLPVYDTVEEDFSSAFSVHIEASGKVKFSYHCKSKRGGC
jgi:hypothetical protein